MPALVCNHMANTGDLSSGEIGSDRDSLDSNFSSDVDLESGGAPAVKPHSGEKKKKKKKKKKRKKKNNGGRNCRICHLDLEGNHGGYEGDGDDKEEDDDEEEEEEEEEEEDHYGLPMQLGCSCKGELGVAHRKCAETWFKMKGNM